MGVSIVSADKNQLTYELVPEYVPEKLVIENLKELKKDNMINNGFTKERTMRHVAQIDYAMWYNYAMGKGIEPWQMNSWYMENNGKNLKAFLSEFPVCKVVDKL